MSIITPSPALLTPNQTQQLATDVPAPFWYILSGIGSVDQTGLYSAPNALGSAIVEAASEFWDTWNATYLSKGADDRLVVIAQQWVPYAATSKAGLTAAGDYVEFTTQTDAYGPGLFKDAALTSGVHYVNGALSSYVNGVQENLGSFAFANNDKLKFERQANNTVKIYKNGVLIATTTQTHNYPLYPNYGLPATTPIGTVIKQPLVRGAGITNYSWAEGEVEVQLAVAPFLANDPLIQFVPKSFLVAWHAANKNVGGDDLTLPDLSQNNRHIVVDANLPDLQEGVANGFPGVYFDGTNNPLKYEEDGDFTVKHIFVVASLNAADFSGNEGLLSDIATNAILIGGGDNTTKFLDIGYPTGYEYRKADVVFAQSNQTAPLQAIAVLEIQVPSGLDMDGIQIGQDRANTSRKWKGLFLEDLMYSEIKDAFDRCQIYQYFAMKYHLWQKSSGGLYIFPFVNNKTRGFDRSKEHYLSEPYTGDPKALVRGNFKREFQVPYLLRHQAEVEAAESFHAQHFPLDHFIFRDYHFHPERDAECRFTAPLRVQGNDVSYRYNYSFDTIETG